MAFFMLHLKPMKTFFTVLSAFLIGIGAFAQISITSDDLPKAGRKYFRSNGMGNNIDLDVTGANTTWDFSNWTRANRDTTQFYSVSSTPFAYQFYFNNPLTPAFVATEAKKTADVDLAGFFTMENNYNFTKKSGSEWQEIGIGTTISGIPLPTKFSNIKTIFNLPLEFNNSGFDDYAYSITIPSIGAIAQEGSTNYVVDGWGTIKLPGGTFEVIRVKTEISKSDSIYVDLLQFGLKIPSNEVVYEWFAKDEGYPVLRVTTGLFNLVTAIEYLDDPLTSTRNIQASVDYKLYPNPVSDVLKIETNAMVYTVEIYNTQGLLVLMEIGNPKRINVSNLPQGTYFLKLKTEQTNHIQSVIIMH